MGNHMNTLEQIKRETRDDARLYACIGIFMIREFLSRFKSTDSRYQTDQRTVTVKTHAAE